MKWSITINKKDIMDILILLLLFMQITFFSFFDIRGTGNILILLSVFIRVFIVGNRNTFKLKIMVALLAIVVLYTISALTGLAFHTNYYIGNLVAIIYPVVPIIYIAWLCLYKKDFLYRFMIQMFPFFNIFYFINLAVVFLQGKIPFFLSGFSDYVNTYIPDLMSGLFGYNGTAQLGLYSIFIVLYNIVCLFYVFVMSRTSRNFAKLYIIFLTASIIITSASNDNKAVFIALFIFLLTAFTIFLSKKRARIRIAYIIIIVAVIFALVFILKYVLTYRMDLFGKISEELLSTIWLVRTFINDPSSYMSGEIGSIERIYMIAYAFNNIQTLPFGSGTAFSFWQTSGTLGFPHFGQSDFSSFLCLGGLVFTISIFLFYFMLYLKITGIPRYNKTVFVILLLMIVFLYFSYTQPWTQTTHSICLALNCIALGMLIDRTSIKKSKQRIC